MFCGSKTSLRPLILAERNALAVDNKIYLWALVSLLFSVGM